MLLAEHMNDEDNVFCATFHRDLSHQCIQALLLDFKGTVFLFLQLLKTALSF